MSFLYRIKNSWRISGNVFNKWKSSWQKTRKVSFRLFARNANAVSLKCHKFFNLFRFASESAETDFGKGFRVQRLQTQDFGEIFLFCLASLLHFKACHNCVFPKYYKHFCLRKMRCLSFFYVDVELLRACIRARWIMRYGKL